MEGNRAPSLGARRPMIMSWRVVIWTFVVLISLLLLIIESFGSLRRSQGKYRAGGLWFRLALFSLPVVATLWIYLSACICIHHLRNLGYALVQEDRAEIPRFFAQRVKIGVNEYDNGPALVALLCPSPPRKGYERPKHEDVASLRFRPCFDPHDPLHV